MKSLKSLVAIVAVTTPLLLSAWGQKGHDVTAHIADRHLTPATRTVVDSLLDGQTMVYWSNWMDNASHTPDYAYTKTWHYRNIDEGDDYYSAPANPAGDVVTAVKSRLEVLRDPHASKADKTLAMKMLIHFVGDLHQPMHVGHATDLGGNRVKVKLFNRNTNLHSAWDSGLLESAHAWSYSEWADNVDRPCYYPADMTEGTIDDWAMETLSIATDIYKETPAESTLSYNEVARWAPVIERQLMLGGNRLAHLLNTLYDPQYASQQP